MRVDIGYLSVCFVAEMIDSSANSSSVSTFEILMKVDRKFLVAYFDLVRCVAGTIGLQRYCPCSV